MARTPTALRGRDRDGPAGAAYDACLETLRRIDEPLYDWSEEAIERLERL